MQRNVNSAVFLFILSILALPLIGQESRTYDGYGNNVLNKEWGSTQSELIRVLESVSYVDNGSEIDPDLPNPRDISNHIFNQPSSEEFFAPDSLSDYVWAFGQFLDHDISLVSMGNEFAPIIVPEDDEFFAPGSFIPIERDAFVAGTGFPGMPRQYRNNISAFIDGSMVYGSDQERADWLRTFEGGKLKTSQGNLLPWNTTDYTNYNTPIDHSAPEMESPDGFSDKLFVAGDVRANENVVLLSLHTLFMREHNRLCEQFAIQHPNWSDEQLYQHARRWVIALIQKITYHEWLPAMGIELGKEMPEYSGYNPEINAGVSNVFSAAAFRMGHTLIGSTVVRMNNDGSIYEDGHLPLDSAFFNPKVLALTTKDIDVYFKGMATHMQQEMDCKVVHSVRNFLFGSPNDGGLDLAAINIFRGRDRGVPFYNTMRTDMGLPRINNFVDLTGNALEAQELSAMYNGDIDKVDAWVGLLAEVKMPEAMLGELLMDVLVNQFRNLRDGDRFYFEVDQGLSEVEKEDIKSTYFRDVIMRNTGISLMQKNVFKAMPHEEIPSGPFITPIHLEAIVYPNPTFDGITTVKLYSNYDGEATLQLLDPKGQLMQKRNYSIIEGDNYLPLDLGQDITRGIYFLQILSDEYFNTVPIIRD